jgi:hypothetical protein
MRIDWYWRRMAFAVIAGILALAFSGCPDPAGNGSTLTEGTLTVTGLPSGGTPAVYIFSPGTDISGYQAISAAYGNGSYQAVGTLAGGNSFTLYTWTGGARGGGFTGTGRYPVLLLNSGGSVTDTANPMYARAEVSFTNGTATVSYSAFTAVVSGGGTGTLTISGLPSGATRAVYIFSSGTDISTYAAITAAYGNGSYQAVGAVLSGGNSFTLYTWTGGAQGGGFTGTGNYQVLLLNSGGSITDSTNPMYARATVSFSNGTGTVSYSDFTAVVSGSFNFTTPAQYREMVSLNGGTITGNTAYYYDPSTTFDYEKGVFIAGRNVTLSAFKIAKYETTYELWDEVKQWADANG